MAFPIALRDAAVDVARSSLALTSVVVAVYRPCVRRACVTE